AGPHAARANPEKSRIERIVEPPSRFAQPSPKRAHERISLSGQDRARLHYREFALSTLRICAGRCESGKELTHGAPLPLDRAPKRGSKGRSQEDPADHRDPQGREVGALGGDPVAPPKIEAPVERDQDRR